VAAWNKLPTRYPLITLSWGKIYLAGPGIALHAAGLLYQSLGN
jgi:hypothetical protein